MGDLFFNKVMGVILALFLGLMVLSIITGVVYKSKTPETPAYPIDLAALDASNGAVEEEQGPIDFGLLLASADISSGERVARRCAACHSFDNGGANGTGPNLWDIMGRTVGSVAGFGYSNAMGDYGSDAKVWAYENMSNFLENPRGYISGTAMSYVGLKKEEDRINMIAYMRSLSENPIALPDPLPTEAGDVEVSTPSEGDEDSTSN